MKNKKLIIIVLVLSFFLSLANTTFSMAKGKISDNFVQASEVISSNKYSDEIKVKEVIEKLFNAKLEILKGSKIDTSVYFYNCITNKEAKYYEDKHTFIKALYNREDIDKESMKIELTFEDIIISDSKASVDLYEKFTFMYTNGNGMPSAMGNRYKISLLEDGSKWQVVEIFSDDEFDEQYYEQEFDIEKLLEALSKPVQNIIDSNINSPDTIHSISSLPFTSYNASSAASYAYTYAENYNSKFESFSSDCQNFASQCVWFGFGGSNTTIDISNGAWPMTSIWYQKGPDQTTSNAWYNVDGFADMIESSESNVSGPYGIINSGISTARVGDILQYNSSSNPSDYVHSYIVYSVTGTEGSRTFSDIYVCAHTTDRKNIQLSTIWSDSSTNRFCTINILGYYD